MLLFRVPLGHSQLLMVYLRPLWTKLNLKLNIDKSSFRSVWWTVVQPNLCLKIWKNFWTGVMKMAQSLFRLDQFWQVTHTFLPKLKQNIFRKSPIFPIFNKNNFLSLILQIWQLLLFVDTLSAFRSETLLIPTIWLMIISSLNFW